MKQSEIHNKIDFRKRSDTSSHYRINCRGNTLSVGVIAKQCVEQLKMKRYE